MAAVRHIEFSKFVIYVMLSVMSCYSAFPCKISMKPDNRLLSYDQKTDFQYGGRPLS